MQTPKPAKGGSSMSEEPITDPADLPLDTPAGDDGDDRDNDLPAEDETS